MLKLDIMEIIIICVHLNLMNVNIHNLFLAYKVLFFLTGHKHVGLTLNRLKWELTTEKLNLAFMKS